MDKIKVDHHKMNEVFFKILIKNHFENEAAKLIADIFTKNSVDGIYSHGVNRFKRFVIDAQKEIIKINNVPSLKNAFNGIEQWSGNMGPGPLNAYHSTERAMELASLYGIGCVSLSETTHWMRGGFYGWQAAEKGYILIAWTNTIAIMPAWGAVNSKLGNNPVVFATPFHKNPIVLDMAISQFSYGSMKNYWSDKKDLPVIGGYDEQGNLTKDPYKILKSERPLPIGYWKGAGFAFLLDILASIISGGLSTAEITKTGHEHGCSQVFIAIDTKQLKNYSTINTTIQNIINDYQQSKADENSEILYPSQRVLKIRNENLKKGIPVNEEIWNKILVLLN